MMTIERWKRIPPGEIVRVVITKYEMVEGGEYGNIMFVVKKGKEASMQDWCIYYDREERGVEAIAKAAAKVRRDDNIREIFPCDDEVFKLYRK